MMTPQDETFTYHYDGTGNTIAITDQTKHIQNTYAYTPFGITTENESFDQPFTFSGEYGVIQEPNNLYYMRARYYDPVIGRFISEDPIHFAGGDVNLYAYVSNDPVNWIDPLGLEAQGPQGGGIACFLGGRCIEIPGAPPVPPTGGVVPVPVGPGIVAPVPIPGSGIGALPGGGILTKGGDSFKGGKKGRRDRNFGIRDKGFWRWWDKFKWKYPLESSDDAWHWYEQWEKGIR
ncbi:MAG: hypothetical protein A3G87_06330 [Omnitrophica bacterium RIFCSPLOWO2_12_FULL_50_11]|nr:MAG: hypothetical protein A3G87_06330 [Omnitrophica bacterium RIFCSPLOWO2_12_FULL_50_11]